ncbi:MAG: 50S ribosomal protein L28 [Flavobacteriales bacterium]|nr:50S ribosomal protein L28 [Flavobacteriales bacterium]
MSKICDLTGKTALKGNNVSHAMNRTKRRFNLNLKKKRFYIPEEGRWITLKVCAKALKTIDKKGIYQVLLDVEKNGFIK